MKIFKILVFNLLISCLLINFFSINSYQKANADEPRWVSLSSGLYGGRVLTITLDTVSSNIIYVGTEDVGIFKSTNQGENWTNISGEISGHGVYSIAIDPSDSSIIYAGTLGGGVFRSTNGGISWSEINSGLTDNSVISLAIDLSNTQTIYAGKWGGGVFKSTDSASSWTVTNTGITNLYVYSLAIDPTDTQTIYAGTWGGGVFKSVNAGLNWTPSNSELSNLNVREIVIDRNNTKIIYVGTRDGVFKSIDGGSRWNQIGLKGNWVDSLAIDPVNTQILYAGASYGIFKSIDGGKDWFEINEGLQDKTCLSLAIDPINTQIIYAGTWDGIYKSINGGAKWFKINNGLTSTEVQSLAVNPIYTQSIYAGTRFCGLFLSKNGGLSWEETELKNETMKIYFDPKNSNTVFVLTSLGMYKSVDGGRKWDWCMVDPKNEIRPMSLAIDPISTKTIYIGSYGDGVFKSTNGGSSWTKINAGLTNTYINSIVIDPKNPQIIYAGTDKGLFKSTNGGLSWSKTGLADALICSLYFDPINSQTIYAASESLFKSTNGGLDWIKLNSDFGFICALVINPMNNQIIYAVSYGSVFKSADGGSNWVQINKGLTNAIVTSLAIDPKNPQIVYAGAYNGVFKLQTFNTITSFSSPGGTISPSGTITVNYGDSKTFTITPNQGYRIKDVLVDGTSVGAVSTYTFDNITSDQTIEAFFERITYTISASSGTGGSISPSGTVTINYGDSKMFTITPNSGYKISNVKVDGVSKGTISSYTFTNITSNHTIEATFEKEVTQTVIILQVDNQYFTVNGATRTLDSSPIIKNSRTLLPIRAIIEALGGTVDWEEKTKVVEIKLGSNYLKLQIGNANAYVNGVQKLIDPLNPKVVPEIINGRTMLPLRFVAENLGCDVQWDGNTKTITITRFAT